MTSATTRNTCMNSYLDLVFFRNNIDNIEYVLQITFAVDDNLFEKPDARLIQ